MVKCIYCGNATKSHWVGYSGTFLLCQSCGLVFRDPFPTENELIELYGKAWEDPISNNGETGGADEALGNLYARELIKSLQRKDLSGARILDYGAGRGFLLKGLLNSGADAYGLEPYGFEGLRQKGLRCFETIESIPEDLHFHGITCMDVFEHLREPWKVIDALKQRLLPGGWLFISTPNPCGLNARLNRGNWREAKKLGHILFASNPTLVRLMHDQGYHDVQTLVWNVEDSHSWLRARLHRITTTFGLYGASRALGFVAAKPQSTSKAGD